MIVSRLIICDAAFLEIEQDGAVLPNPSLKDSVAVENVLQLGALNELAARGVLAGHLFEGACENFLFDLARHDNDPVDLWVSSRAALLSFRTVDNHHPEY
jgi:hypothetical protein